MKNTFFSTIKSLLPKLSISYFSTRLLLIVTIGCGLFLDSQAQTSTTPLDSMKQVFITLNIPTELQEDWINALERYEDDQYSSEFKRVAAEVNEQLENYLLQGIEGTAKLPKKQKKRKFLERLEEKVMKVKKDIALTIPLELAKATEKSGEYSTAIKHYEIVVLELEKQERWEEAIQWKEHIALLYENQEDNLTALEQWKVVKEKMIARGMTTELPRINQKIQQLEKLLNIASPPPPPPIKTTIPTVSPTTPKPTVTVSTEVIVQTSKQIEEKAVAISKTENKVVEMKRKAARAEKEKDLATSLQLNKELLAMERTLQAQKIKMEGDKRLLAENKFQLLEQQAALKEQELLLKEEATFKRNLWAGLGLLGSLAIALYFLYANKQRAHHKLGIAYKELATAQHHLKDAESRIKNLLKQQLSGDIANELLATGGLQKMEQRFVCILFLDIRDFTPFVENLSPEEIINYQNNVLGFMIEKVIEHKGVVNTILGDGFMATFGAPISAGNDCLQAHRAASEIMELVKSKSESGEIPPTRIGIGLHAGYVVAGNVGTKERKQYSITGNPVIIASRLEQLNKKYQSTMIVSKEVFEQLPDDVDKPTTFDAVAVKGRKEPVEIARFF